LWGLHQWENNLLYQKSEWKCHDIVPLRWLEQAISMIQIWWTFLRSDVDCLCYGRCWGWMEWDKVEWTRTSFTIFLGWGMLCHFVKFSGWRVQLAAVSWVCLIRIDTLRYHLVDHHSNSLGLLFAHLKINIKLAVWGTCTLFDVMCQLYITY